MSELGTAEEILDRMERAVEKVPERLHRSTGALEAAKIPYAVADDNAVATWIDRVDESVVRNTPDVDILLRRSDLEAAKAVLATAGFVHRSVNGTDMFLDGPNARPRYAVHIIFAGERVHSDDLRPAPDVSESEASPSFWVLALQPLVMTLLISFRSKDRMHLYDMIEVGLVDATWLPRLPAEPAARLKELLDNPEG